MFYEDDVEYIKFQTCKDAFEVVFSVSVFWGERVTGTWLVQRGPGAP